jgi:hypothetical protein
MKGIRQEGLPPGSYPPIDLLPDPTTKVAEAPWRIPRKVVASKVSLASFRAPAGGPGAGVISITADGWVVATTTDTATAEAVLQLKVALVLSIHPRSHLPILK